MIRLTSYVMSKMWPKGGYNEQMVKSLGLGSGLGLGLGLDDGERLGGCQYLFSVLAIYQSTKI